MTIPQELFSLQTNAGVTLHALAVRQPQDTVISALFHAAETGGWAFLPIVLQTTLIGNSAVAVHAILNHDDKVRKLLQRVLSGKDQHHISIFLLPTGCPEDKRLMELH